MSNYQLTLRKKILNKEAVIAVVGLGYVGLPLAVAFAKKGFFVIGYDLYEPRIKRINNLQSYIADVDNQEIADIVSRGYFQATLEDKALKQADIIIVCVPTPLKRKYTPDVSFMTQAVKTIAKHLNKKSLVVLESTTYPGTTEELIKPILEAGGLKAGKDFFLAFSPERIDPGNKEFAVTSIPKVVGGLTAACSDLTKLLYSQIISSVHVVSSPKAAEMTKLLENSFRIVNIGWINEVAQMCHHLGINVWEVIGAAKTKPFGFMPFYPGLGVGGHCIPEDPLYLYWKAKRYGFNSKFIKLAADINMHMPMYVLHRIQEILASTLEKKKILVVGVTYKKDVKDLRKSPALRLLELLKSHHARVDYHDPFVDYLKIGSLDMHSMRLNAKVLKSYDMVIVAVDHSNVNYAMMHQNAKRIFDVKNIYGDKTRKHVYTL